jgi:indolepyruvate ferredoxin oxidoreductase
VSQILATAAVSSGLHVRGLDQTGLAQKGGAVVSDLKISPTPWEGSGRLAEGECDLYLGADLLVAADAKNLACTQPARTIAVISTARIPTGPMVVDPGISFPDSDRISKQIIKMTRSNTFLDARRISEQLFGDDQYSNMVLVGAAFQVGALPLSAESIEHAIKLNGAAVAKNVQAFRRGRQAIADPKCLARQLTLGTGTPTIENTEPPPDGSRLETPGTTASELLSIVRAKRDTELARLVAVRAPDLTAYQNASYASDFVAFVEHVRAAESAAVPGAASLAEAVARNLYKLMAYKDEYEVARLILEPSMTAQIEAQFGPGARPAWKLHPPVLRALGMKKKMTLDMRFRLIFRVLRGLRGLRGTPFDIFGHTHVRRVERELIVEYRAVIERLLPVLGANNHARAVAIAGLPDLVRGYEQIKLDSVNRYRARLSELLDSMVR